MKDVIVSTLEVQLPRELAVALTEQFFQLRTDVTTKRTSTAASGRFVETWIQAVQYLATGTWDRKPEVENFFRTAESSLPQIDEGRRVVGIRVARAVYAIRSKREVVHNGTIDSNSHDLAFQMSGVQWILAELIRNCSGGSMQASGDMLRYIAAVPTPIVEVTANRRLVLEDVSVRSEILLQLFFAQPETMSDDELVSNMDRRPLADVRKRTRELWKERLVDTDQGGGYFLTTKGLNACEQVLSKLAVA